MIFSFKNKNFIYVFWHYLISAYPEPKPSALTKPGIFDIFVNIFHVYKDYLSSNGKPFCKRSATVSSFYSGQQVFSNSNKHLKMFVRIVLNIQPKNAS
jgi:hypothetical protein